MKKLLSLVLCICLVGCSNISQKDYDALLKEKVTLETEVNYLKRVNESLQESEIKKENDVLKRQLTNAELELSKYEQRLDKEIKDFKISGGFVATLRHLMPDYGVDDRVIGIAICQWFQGDTFAVRIDSELASKLKVNTTYYFEIEEKIIERYTLNELKLAVYSENYIINIIGVRTPNENELGLASPSVTIEEVK